MANTEHLNRLLQGSTEWNAWRQANPTVPDLSGADLRSANLRWASLGGANLTQANLQGADISQGSLSGSKLRQADLRGANLQGTTLIYTDCTGADLSGTNLSGALMLGTDLTRANLYGANLRGAQLARAIVREPKLDKADLSGAHFQSTLFSGASLSRIIGLETCHHKGPSSIDHETLRTSPDLPEEFLRGCGLQDWEVESYRLYDPSLSREEFERVQYRIEETRYGNPLQIGSLFISYTHADEEFVYALEPLLRGKGIRFWRDIHDAPAGPLDKIVDDAMRLNDTVLLILSERSVKSDWVESEARRARKLEKTLSAERGEEVHVLCPIALDDAWRSCGWSDSVMTQIRKYNVLPFQDWRSEAAMTGMFHRLVEGLGIFYKRERD